MLQEVRRWGSFNGMVWVSILAPCLCPLQHVGFSLVFSWSQDAAVALGITSLYNLLYRQVEQFFLIWRKTFPGRYQLTPAPWSQWPGLSHLHTPWIPGRLTLSCLFSLYGCVLGYWGSKEEVWGGRCLLGGQLVVNSTVFHP